MLCEKNDDDKNSAFDKLKDDCCYEILRRLRLDDLCALSQTCTRLHRLCSKQFREEYPSKVMRVEWIQEDGTWVKEPNDEMYVKCFDKSIRIVVLYGDDLDTKLHVINGFYAAKEMVDVVKEVHFKHWRSLNGVGISLVDMLKSVETIAIEYATIDEDLYDCILKHAPKLKNLSFCNVNFTSTDWMTQRYEQLKCLEWHSQSHEPNADKIKFMLDTNPNIERFSLVCTNMDRITELYTKSVKIDELFVRLNCGTNEYELTADEVQFNYAMNILNKLIAAQNVNLYLIISNPDVVSKLPHIHSSVVGIHFTVSIDNVLTTMYTFENLEFLRIEASDLPLAYFDMIRKMPNLTELYIDKIYADNFESFHQFILAAAGELIKLTKIFLNGHPDQLEKIDFFKMNQQRMELVGAAHLKIYIHSKKFNFPFKFAEFEMMEIVAAETEPSNFPLFSSANALIGHNVASQNYQHPRTTNIQWENSKWSEQNYTVGFDDINDGASYGEEQNSAEKNYFDEFFGDQAGPSGTSKPIAIDVSDWEDDAVQKIDTIAKIEFDDSD